MSEDNIIREVPPPPSKPADIEEHGILTDVVVPIVSGGVGGAIGGAVNAYVSNVMQRPSEPPPPPPPSIELPPGTDRE